MHVSFLRNLSPTEQFAIIPPLPLFNLISINNNFALILSVSCFSILSLFVLCKRSSFKKSSGPYTILGFILKNFLGMFTLLSILIFGAVIFESSFNFSLLNFKEVFDGSNSIVMASATNAEEAVKAVPGVTSSNALSGAIFFGLSIVANPWVGLILLAYAAATIPKDSDIALLEAKDVADDIVREAVSYPELLDAGAPLMASGVFIFISIIVGSLWITSMEMLMNTDNRMPNIDLIANAPVVPDFARVVGRALRYFMRLVALALHYFMYVAGPAFAYYMNVAGPVAAYHAQVFLERVMKSVFESFIGYLAQILVTFVNYVISFLESLLKYFYPDLPVDQMEDPTKKLISNI